MANTVGFNVTGGNLPASPSYSTLQELFDAFVSLLEINLDEDYGLFGIGSSAPDNATQSAWLRNGLEWYVYDTTTGSWRPADIDDDYKKIYVQASDPTATETVSNDSLWVDLNAAGTSVDDVKIRLDGAWVTATTSQSDFDALKERVDAVITDAGSSSGIVNDTVEYDDLTSAAKTSINTAALQAAYPVGSLYFNASSSVNPETLLGFGTWSAFGESRLIMGAGSGSGLTTRNLGATGGAETVTLAEANLPSATEIEFYAWNGTTDDDKVDAFRYTGGGGDPAIGGEVESPKAYITENIAGTTIIRLKNASDTAVDIMNPFIAVNAWQRTA
jgi:hypothetical protein